MLQALLPLIEALGPQIGAMLTRTGGTGATLSKLAGSMGTTSGTSGTGLSRLLGAIGRGGERATPFGSTAELGGATRQISELQERTTYDQGRITSIGEQIAKRTAAGANDQEIGQLAQMKAKREAMLAEGQKQISDLQARAKATTDQQNPTFAGAGGQGAMPEGLKDSLMAAAKGGALVLGVSHAAKVVGNAGSAAANIGKLGVGQAEQGVIGGAADFAKDSAKMAMNPLAMARGDLIVQMSRLPGLILEWSESLVESRRSIMRWNGTLIHAFHDAERRGIIRNIESGQRTAPQTARLSDALEDIKDYLQPAKDAVTNTITQSLALLIRAVLVTKDTSVTMRKLEGLGYVIKSLLETKLGVGGESKERPLDIWIKDVAKYKPTEKKPIEKP